MSEAKVFPIGKHKGKPVELVMADTQYAEWIMAQPWFREKFAPIYWPWAKPGSPVRLTPTGATPPTAGWKLAQQWCLLELERSKSVRRAWQRVDDVHGHLQRCDAVDADGGSANANPCLPTRSKN
jgi:hypothetical protein